jgi:phosphoglycerate dehydrogenase-like enzyme
MEVDAIRRRPEPDEARDTGVRELATPSHLSRLAAEADFLVCTATATEDARGMINASTFHAMKPTAFVVNVSRGAVINEPALIAALRNGLIAGAGLDVFAQEPVDLRSPLLRMENVIATPHVAGVTRQSYEGIARAIAANVRAVKEGRTPNYCVNPDVRPA